MHDQLKAQQITMPAAAALTTPDMKANLTQYAGQDLTTGAQAKAYADYYIQEHMNASSGGKTYSQVSGEFMAASKADPTAQATQDLGDLRQSLFMGTTLRGMLLNAYAFATLGTIAMWAAIAAFIGCRRHVRPRRPRHPPRPQGRGHRRPRHREHPGYRLTPLQGHEAPVGICPPGLRCGPGCRCPRSMTVHPAVSSRVRSEVTLVLGPPPSRACGRRNQL